MSTDKIEIERELFEQIDTIQNIKNYVYLDSKNLSLYEFALINLKTGNVYTKTKKDNRLVKQDYLAYETAPEKEENIFKYFFDRTYPLELKEEKRTYDITKENKVTTTMKKQLSLF